nr:uncharacterized protein LOC129272108 [Lytechinus pictus]
MADSLHKSASRNPFGSTTMEEQEATRHDFPSSLNPFSLPPRSTSPGNPFATPVTPLGNPPDEEGLPFGDVCEPMQPIRLDDMIPGSASRTKSDVDTMSHGPSSKKQDGVFENHVPDGPSSGTSDWVNNTNNSNRADETAEDVGFGDDFGSLSHTDVIFKTGFMDSNFKAVAVTAEEDDLWSSSFIMEDLSANEETLLSSGDQESTNQRAQTCPDSNVHIEVDCLPDLPEGLWQEDSTDQHFAKESNPVPDPWMSEDLTFEHSQWVQNSQAADVEDLFSRGGSDPWGADAKMETTKETGHHQVDGLGQDPWTPCKNAKEADDHKLAKPKTLDLSSPLCNPFSSRNSVGTTLQDPSSPFQDDPTSPFHPDYDPALHRSNPSSFPFQESSKLQGGTSSSHSDPWSPSPTSRNLAENHSQGSSAFHSQNTLTTHDSSTSTFQFSGSTRPQESPSGTLNNPWSPCLTPANGKRDGSGRSRSPNPFALVEDTANPFLPDLDLLPGKLERMNQREVSVKEYACSLLSKY